MADNSSPEQTDSFQPLEDDSSAASAPRYPGMEPAEQGQAEAQIDSLASRENAGAVNDSEAATNERDDAPAIERAHAAEVGLIEDGALAAAVSSSGAARPGPSGSAARTSAIGAGSTPSGAYSPQSVGTSQRRASDEAGLDLLLDVPLQLSVELGRTRLTVSEILALRVGSVLELDKMAGEPGDILVNGTLIARGEVVVVDEKFGVRIVEVLPTSRRLATVG